jgi:F-type H+-transporting ATPase subunit b
LRTLPVRFASLRRMLGTAVLAALVLAPAAVPSRAAAQQPAPSGVSPSATSDPTPATAETPRSEEDQENGFLNAPIVHKMAHALNLSEPAARTLFLAINFLIIFFGIAIPLVRIMPKVFRKRAQNLGHDLDLARKATEEARQRMSAVEAKLAGLDQEIAHFRAQIEQESRQDETRIKATLQEESQRVLAAAEQEITAAAAHARRSLRSFAADLAIEQASRQIVLTPETDRALIHDFIGQVAEENGRGDGETAHAGSPAAAGKRGAN